MINREYDDFDDGVNRPDRIQKGKVIMRKPGRSPPEVKNKGGRRKAKVWDHFEPSKEKEGYIKCKHCEEEVASSTSATRLKAHLDRKRGKGISICKGISRPTNFCSDNENSNDLKDSVLLSSQRQIQVDAKDQERIEVGSSSVSNRDKEDLQVLKYVFKLSEDVKVYESSLLHLTQKQFATLKPGAYLDSWVIDSFAEILTNIERKKKTMPSNWYLPVTFSNAALKGSVDDFWDFVLRQKLRENYTSGDLDSCEKMFIPVHTGETHRGHFYLYIIHLMNKEIEIWDPLPKTSVAQCDETTKKLLHAMEVLFWRKFTEFELKIANNYILFQDNGFDCGIFVINYMQQSNNYVKRDDSIFQFDSTKEREDLALKLLKSDLNQVKQDIYKEARQHYATQVEKQGLGKLKVIAAGFGDISAFNAFEGGRKHGEMLPCAACKLLWRSCDQDCLFAPYFPADEPHQFANVHKVFGASNVNKMLQELPEEQRSDAVSSMVYEANARMRDPVYGSVGAISCLQQQVDVLQTQLALAQAELVHIRIHQQQPSSSSSPPTSEFTQSLWSC